MLLDASLSIRLKREQQQLQRTEKGDKGSEMWDVLLVVSGYFSLCERMLLPCSGLNTVQPH